MTNMEILLPFALPPSEHAKDLLLQLQAPALARLLSSAKATSQSVQENFARQLPHEQWLSKTTHASSPPLARAAMAMLNLPTDQGLWFIVQPASLHIARDHLVLTDLRQLELSDTESRSLFDAALPYFTESGFTLCYGCASHWFMRADTWQGMQCSTPDAACGHNIDIWLPTGEKERDWRRLHNELQMLWHTHPVNDAREARGARRINAAWLWGQSATEAEAQQTGLQTLAALSLQAPATSALIPELIAPALAGDWSQWLQAFAQAEQEQLAPALQLLSDGKLDTITLVLTDSQRLMQWHISRNALRKFWIKPSLKRLAS
ncbi:MAG: hypothetical protein WBJ21_02715 [Burkholderiaceae bacterium]